MQFTESHSEMICKMAKNIAIIFKVSVQRLLFLCNTVDLFTSWLSSKMYNLFIFTLACSLDVKAGAVPVFFFGGGAPTRINIVQYY